MGAAGNLSPKEKETRSPETIESVDAGFWFLVLHVGTMNAQETTETTETVQPGRGRKRAWPIFFWLFVFVFIAYPLSLAPVVKLGDTGFLDREFVLQMYKPVFFLYLHVPLVDKFFEWYLFSVWKCATCTL
jgi:hypothetical protein